MTARLVVVTVTLVFGAALIRAVSVETAHPLRIALAQLPSELDGWNAIADHPLDTATVAVLRADDHVARTYARHSEIADLFVAYYASQRQGQAIHSPMNCLPAAGWEPVSSTRVQVDVARGSVIDANRYLIQKGREKQLVLYWYQSHGRSIASEYSAKAYLVLDSIRWGRSDAALVRVVAPISGDDVSAERSAINFVRAVQPILGRYLPG